ncbi:MAG: hypothetical protein HC882_04025 [Acidobacteria bacterium]|nr:hypothetical protein [Acidobacteriota bacterium]
MCGVIPATKRGAGSAASRRRVQSASETAVASKIAPVTWCAVAKTISIGCGVPPSARGASAAAKAAMPEPDLRPEQDHERAAIGAEQAHSTLTHVSVDAPGAHADDERHDRDERRHRDVQQ